MTPPPSPTPTQLKKIEFFKVLENEEATRTDLLDIFDLLTDLIIECPNSLDVLLRFAEVCYKISEKTAELEDKRRFIRRGNS